MVKKAGIISIIITLSLIASTLCGSEVNMNVKVPELDASEDASDNSDSGTFVNELILDYRVAIAGGANDCYFQNIHEHASLYVLLEVLKGGDEHCAFYIMHPNGTRVFHEAWAQEAEYSDDFTTYGSYGICIDNSGAVMTTRLIRVYIYISRPETEWEKMKSEELEALDIEAQSFKKTLAGIERKIGYIFQHLYHSSAMESRDYALLLANNFHIAFWSALQCFAVIATTSCQVYFVRKLFTSPKSGMNAGTNLRA